MSSPLPAMFHAACPNCGGRLGTGVSGNRWVTCVCGFHGQVMMQPAPPAPPAPIMVNINPSALVAAFGAIGAGMSDDEQLTPEQSDEDRWRDALRRHANEMVSSVQGAMRSLTDADWRLPLWQVYERVQEAHGALYRALGERRMGDYQPGRLELDQALVKALLWQVMLLHAAERMREER